MPRQMEQHDKSEREGAGRFPGRELPDALVLGIDVTWWGGGRNRASQSETIISARLRDPSSLQITRVDLSAHENPLRAAPTEPNFDADGGVLHAAILEILAQHADTDCVIVALDAPLECLDRPGQPARRRAVARGESTGSMQREAERALRAFSRDCAPEVRRGWAHDLRIQAGSPIPCRIARIVDRLREDGLAPYRTGGVDPPRGVLEVFPSEAIWSLGLIGAYGSVDSATVRAYKTKKPRRLTLDAAHEIARRPLVGFATPLVAGGLLHATASAWIDAIANAAVEGALGSDGLVRKSKSFDDAIDSGIAFLTALACALGQSHTWGDGTDGTIVGPGRLPL